MESTVTIYHSPLCIHAINFKYSFLFRLRSKLTEALQDTDVDAHSDYASKSRNYRLPNVQGNIIFDPNSQLPREVLLETTLEAFGYKKDIFEVK